MSFDSLDVARKSLLSQMNNPSIGRNAFSDLFDKVEHDFPGLIEEYRPDASNSELSQDMVDWSADYFDRHSFLAERNFSRERINHLLDVRDHLIKLGVKGFVPYFSPAESNSERNADMTANLAPSPYLQGFVLSGDLFSIRVALYQEFRDNSLAGADLRAVIAWVETRKPELFDDYAVRAFARGIEPDKSDIWTSKYYDTQGVYLLENFSRERLLHLIEVRELLRQKGVEGFVAMPPKPRANRSQASHSATQAQHAASDENDLLTRIMEMISKALDKALQGIESGASALGLSSVESSASAARRKLNGQQK